MDLKTLWENFDVIAEAENGIQQFQELVFSLAIRGAFKLQHSNDKPASELLEKATQEKLSQVKNQRKKQTKEINPIEIPEDWNLPLNWEWSSLENLGVINPRNEISDDLNAGFVPMPLVPIDYRDAVSFETKQWSKIKKGYTHFANDDVGLAKITPCFENRKSVVFSNLPNGYGSGTTELIIFRPLSGVLNSKFVLLFFKSPFFLENGANQLTGTAGQKRVPRDFVAKCPFPLPPLEEQQRIVKKVDELMELCDRAEASKKNRNELQQQLRRSAIHALETAETEEDFEKSWHFVRDNFSAIVTQSNGIKEFRYFILDLAIRGKLTSQNPDDEPATTLLSKIKLEKQEINQKSLNLSSKDKVVIEAPFDIPKNWLWVHLFEVCLKITDGEHLTPNYSNTGVPMLSAKHIGQQSLILKDYKLVSNEDAKQFWGRCFPEKGDILIVSRGGGIGRVIISDRDNYCLMGSVLLLKVSRFIRNKYLLYYLLSSTGNEKLKNTSNFTAQEAIYITHLKRNYVIPLPPLEEQKRIVNKVDELMKICDRAEESLRKKEELASAISASVIHHLKL